MIDHKAIAKAGGLPCPRKGGIDMSALPFGKTNRKQREDKKARKEVHRPICEMPGCYKWAQEGPHHVIRRSRILIDHRLNLISLCDGHHLKADQYEIAQVDLFEIIADREGTTFEQLLEDLGRFAGVLLYTDKERVKVKGA